MRYRLMLGAVCTCLIASPALAADLGAPRGLPPPDDNYVSPSKPPLWQGLYWGLSGGYGWGDSSGSLGETSASTDPEGWLAGLSVGYNMLLGSSLLLGIEGDLGVMDVSAKDKVAGDDGAYRASLGPWWGTLRGRAGLAMGPLLLYGTGGLAFVNLDKVSLNLEDNFAEDSELRAGWVAGGGVEFAFSQSVSAKVEYLHMDFGSTDGLAEGGGSYSFDNKVDVVRAGLNFRF